MKTEIRKLRSRYNLYLEKTNEILLVCEEESKKYEEQKENVTRKGTINTMKETLTSTFHMSNNHGRDSTGLEEEAEKIMEEDEIQTNLNKIRSLIREMSKTVRLRKNLVLNISKEYASKNVENVEDKENIFDNVDLLKKQESLHDKENNNITSKKEDNVEHLEKTQNINDNNCSNLQDISTPPVQTSPVTDLVQLIQKVPRLIPEEFVQRCQGCDINFGICTWKYHCRACGFVFCFYCSWNFDNFLPFYMYAVRICNKCVATKKNKCYLKNF